MAVAVGARVEVAVALAVGKGDGLEVSPHATQSIAMLAESPIATNRPLMARLYLSGTWLSTCFDNRPRQLIMDCRVVVTVCFPRRF